MDEIIYTPDDVATLLRLSRRKVEKMVIANEFVQPFYLGDLPRWQKADVLAWVETQLKPGARIGNAKRTKNE